MPDTTMTVYVGALAPAEDDRPHVLRPTGKSGGEGDIFAFDNDAGIVAKVYDPAKATEQARLKAESMARIYPDQIAGEPALQNLSWPMQTLYHDAARSSFAGFTMKAFDGVLFNRLCVPDHPKRIVKTIRERIDLLIGLCQTVAALHSRGVVIGDFNENNIIYLPATDELALIDVDSFHFDNYPCTVCLSGYGAPEVQRGARTYGSYAAAHRAGISFNEDSDNFALAIHIWRMLFNGVHPFYTNYVQVEGASSKVPPVDQVDRNICDGATPFFRDLTDMEATGNAPDTGGFPGYLMDDFRIAFTGPTKAERAQLAGHLRPTAAMWERTLRRYRDEIRQCPGNPNHYHHPDAARCPYCHPKTPGPDAPKRIVLPDSAKTNSTPSVPAKPAISKPTGPARQTPRTQPANAKSRRFPFSTAAFLFGALILVSIVTVGWGLTKVQAAKQASEQRAAALSERAAYLWEESKKLAPIEPLSTNTFSEWLGECGSESEDSLQSVEWWANEYLASAQRGRADDMFALGVCYHYGRGGLPQDDTKAVEWWTEASAERNRQIEYDSEKSELALQYHLGWGVPQDDAQAAYWWELAAKNSRKEAAYALGWCYYHGRGVAQNYGKAVEWWDKAEFDCFEEASFAKGVCYHFGLGVDRDDQYAFSLWYGEFGFAESKYAAGLCYEAGWGVDRNLDDAAYWYGRAAEEGYADAQKRLEELEST